MNLKENKARKAWITPEVIIISSTEVQSGKSSTFHEGTLVATPGGNFRSHNGTGVLNAPSFYPNVHS